MGGTGGSQVQNDTADANDDINGSGPATDYLDFDLVDLKEDLDDIATILKLSDIAKDKASFTLFAMNICLTCFLIGYVPNYFYLWYSVKAVILLTYRWYAYKKIGSHYFLFDFCYFTNFLLLNYLWLPENILGPTLRGALYSACFSFSMGPLLSAIILWRNSLVPHSNDKMTSLFIHVSPPLAVWGIRWFATEEQGFPLCAYPTGPGPQGCDHASMNEIVYIPMLLYALWQTIYIVVIFIWRRERLKTKKYHTSYSWLVERAKAGFLYRIFHIFGEKYRKPMFVIWQGVYTTVSILPVYLCYHYQLFSIALVMVVMLFACHNGASFYIDVFSQRYYFEKVLKIYPSKPQPQASGKHDKND